MLVHYTRKQLIKVKVMKEGMQLFLDKHSVVMLLDAQQHVEIPEHLFLVCIQIFC